MSDLSKLVGLVAPRLPMAPDPAIEDAAVAAFRAFCIESKVWRATFDPQPTVKDSPYLWLSAFGPKDGFVFDVEALDLDNRPLDFGTHHTAVMRGLAGRTGRPQMYDRVPGDELKLYPTPDKVYTVSGSGFFAPKDTITDIPDFIMDRFARTLMHGALFELANMSRKPWSDPEVANDSGIQFQAGIQTARDYAKGTNQHKIRVTSYGGL